MAILIVIKIQEAISMARKMKKRFEELYEQNIKALLKDDKAMSKIEKQIDQRHMDRLEG